MYNYYTIEWKIRNFCVILKNLHFLQWHYSQVSKNFGSHFFGVGGGGCFGWIYVGCPLSLNYREFFLLNIIYLNNPTSNFGKHNHFLAQIFVKRKENFAKQERNYLANELLCPTLLMYLCTRYSYSLNVSCYRLL